MRAYSALLAFMTLCSLLVGMQLREQYRPSMELLQRTTPVTGKLHFYDRGRGGYVARLNGIDLMCRMNFFGAQVQCPERVPALREGTTLTAAIAYVPALFNTVPLAMSISIDGAQVYAVTPEQVIEEWNRSSRGGLLAGPAVVLFLMVLVPIMVSAGFRESLFYSFR
jgi:hypothetical protein